MAEEDLFAARKAKIDALQGQGIDPYPVEFSRTHTAAQIPDEFANLQAGQDSGKQATVAGRLISSRVQGKIGFGDVLDATGKIQLFVTRDGIDAFDQLDAGDIVGAKGEIVRTKRGELSV